MTQWLKEWIGALCACAMICAAALALTPSGRVRKVQRLVCSTVMLLALISPLCSIDIDVFARAQAQFRQLEQSMLQQTEETGKQLNRSIIEQQYAAYILDKAVAMGHAPKAASVTARWDEEGCWYPWEATIDGTVECRRQMAAVIEAELGIPAQRQHWSCDTDVQS